jgi:hypothetical protein
LLKIDLLSKKKRENTKITKNYNMYYQICSQLRDQESHRLLLCW